MSTGTQSGSQRRSRRSQSRRRSEPRPRGIVRLLPWLGMVGWAAAATAWRHAPGCSPILVAAAAGLAAMFWALAAVLAFERIVWRTATSSSLRWVRRLAALALGPAVAIGLGALLGRPVSAPVLEAVEVAPFVNASNDPESDWLARGLADLLQAALIERSVRVQRISSGAEDGAGSGSPARARVQGRLIAGGDHPLMEYEIVPASGGRPLARGRSGGEGRSLGAAVDEMASGIVSRGFPDLAAAGPSPGGLEQAMATDPRAIRAYVEGRTAQAGSRFSEATVAFRQAVLADPKFALAHAQLARCTLDPAEQKTAINLAMEYKFRLGRRDQLLVDAIYAEIIEEPEAARRAYRRQTERFPDDPAGFMGLAIYCGYCRDFEGALAAAGRAEELDPKAAAGMRIRPLLELGRTAAALEAARRLAETGTPAADALVRLGTCYQAAGQLDRALACLERAQELEPWVCQRDLVRAYAMLGRLQQSRRHLQVFIEGQAADYARRAAGAELAWIEFLYGDPAQAAVVADRIMSEDPSLSMVVWIRCLIACDQGDLPLARRLLERLRSSLDDGFWVQRVNLGRIADQAEARLAVAEGDCRRAVDILERAIPLEYPTSRWFLRIEQARALEACGDPATAAAALESELKVHPACPALIYAHFSLAVRQKDAETAHRTGRILLDLWATADPEFALRREVERMLTGITEPDEPAA